MADGKVLTVPVPATAETLDLLREGDPCARQVFTETALHAASTTRPRGPGVHYATQNVLSAALRLNDAMAATDGITVVNDPMTDDEWMAISELMHSRRGLGSAVEGYREAVRLEQLEDDARYDRDRGIGQ